MFHRILIPLYSNSFFLFGARGVGKSSFLKNEFFKNTQNILCIDLLLSSEEVKYSAEPSLLYNEILAISDMPEWIVIDEVQKVPALLDIVHKLIEEKKIKFALTGSSARKLKRSHANMLAGRAFLFKLFPLTFIELGDTFQLDSALAWGTLPKIFSFTTAIEKSLFLESYCETYLKEEIIVEQLVRNIPPFRKFLEIAAQMNAEEINYSNIARDIRVDPKTVENYFAILEDTLLGFILPGYETSIRRQQSQTPKFYLFDTGVKRALSKTLDAPLRSGTAEYGKAFEHFLISEIYRLNIYYRKNFTLSYFRSKDGVEVDLILSHSGHHKFIEIKSTTSVTEHHTNSLNRLLDSLPEKDNYSGYCFSNDPVAKVFGSVKAVHWRDGLKELGIV